MRGFTKSWRNLGMYGMGLKRLGPCVELKQDIVFQRSHVAEATEVFGFPETFH